jgi:LPXTG-motif cell wall-anchored protein
MARAGTTSGSRRLLAGLTLAALSVGLPGGLAFADDDDGDKKHEAYPPTPTKPPVTPTTQQIPKTGNDGTDMWVKLGAGAVLVGGVMVAATSRRRRGVEA